MSGAELLAAPLAGLTLVVITWLHLRRDEATAPLFAPAWLLPEASGAELRGGRRFTAPALWLARLLCALTLLIAPTSWRPWAELLNTPEAPQHTLILTEGARLTPLDAWGEGAWVARVERCGGRVFWLNAQGELSEGGAHLTSLSSGERLTLDRSPRSTSLPLTPSSQRACHHPQSKESLLARALHELSRHGAPPPKRALWVSEERPRVRIARLSWVPREPTLIVEAHVHAPLDEPLSDGSLSLWLTSKSTSGPQARAISTLTPLPPPRAALWRAELSPSAELLALLDRGSTLELRYQPPSSHPSSSHIPSPDERLTLNVPPRAIIAPQGGWPEGMPPLLKSVGVKLLTPDQLAERSARGARVWRPFHHQMPHSRGERLFLFEEGDEPPVTLWGASLEQGAVGIARRWRDLNSVPLPSLTPSSQREVILWGPALKSVQVTSPLKPLTPLTPLIAHRAVMLDLTPIALPQGEALLTRLAWRPTDSEEELSALSPLMAEWGALDRSALSAPEGSTLTPAIASLSELTLTPHTPQREEPLSLPADLSASYEPAPHSPSSHAELWRWALLLALLLLTLIKRAPLHLGALALSALWLLSALPLGVKEERGLWGWWRGPSHLAVSSRQTGEVDGVDGVDAHEERQALAFEWRRRLSLAGAELTPPHLAHAQLVVCAAGDCPPASTPTPLWLIETPAPPRQAPTLSIAELEQRWGARLEGVWLTTRLAPSHPLAQAELATLERYELRLTGALPQHQPLKVAECEGTDCLSLAPALYLPSPPQKRGTQGRALELWRGREGEERLIERHPCPPPARPSAPRAWRWGGALNTALRDAGFVSASAPSDLSLLNAEALSEVNLIALHNPPLEHLGASEVAHLESWVRAGGLLLLSGSASAPDPERALARLSPLNSTPPQRDQARVLMLIDVSGSAAREAGGLGVQALIHRASALASALYPSDEVGFITFAGEASLALPPTPREQLEVALAPERAYGGSRVSAALQEALRWLGEGGPQRWLILSDGELSSQGLAPLAPQLSDHAQRHDLSLALALTSDAPLSAQGRATLKALSSALPVEVRPLSAWTPSALLSWRQARPLLSTSPSPSPSLSQHPLKLTSRGRGRFGEEASPPIAEGVGLSSLNEGAYTLATTPFNELSVPVIAERAVGAGRVIALNASRLTLNPAQWRALLAPARAQLKSPWRFAWRLNSRLNSPHPLFTARWPGGAHPLPPPLHAGWVQGQGGELISGQWRPLLSDLYALRAQDGGTLDERAGELRYAPSLELGALTPQGPLRVQRTLPTLPTLSDPQRAHTPSTSPSRRLNARTPPSEELLHLIIESGREGAPLPERALWWLVFGALLVALTQERMLVRRPPL